MQSEFQKASEIVKKADPIKDVNNDNKLEFYSLFKQANTGNINTNRPGMFDISGRAKWDSWKSKEGMEKDDAMYKYIQLTKEFYKM